MKKWILGTKLSYERPLKRTLIRPWEKNTITILWQKVLQTGQISILNEVVLLVCFLKIQTKQQNRLSLDPGPATWLCVTLAGYFPFHAEDPSSLRGNHGVPKEGGNLQRCPSPFQPFPSVITPAPALPAPAQSWLLLCVPPAPGTLWGLPT